MVLTNALGQAGFSPPPSVRGMSSSAARQTTSPAFVAPSVVAPTSPTPAVSNPITPTSNIKLGNAKSDDAKLMGAKPVEGGEIVARIDGQIVLASDVLWQVDQMIAANIDRIPPEKIGEARHALLQQQVLGMVDNQIIYANFRRQIPAENLAMIKENLREPFYNKEVPRLIKMLKLKDLTELDALLRKSGTSLPDLQRQFTQRTIAGEWLRQMIPKPKEATYDDILAYYKKHKKDYEYPSQAKWEEVMVRFDRHNGDRTATWQAITGLGNEIWQHVATQPGLRGPVFADIAKAKSHGHTSQQGGQHDWTTKDSLRNEAINKALFSLQVGQLSNVIESDSGFHIIRVLDRKIAGRTPFTETQKEIRAALGKDQRKGLANIELAKLRKNSQVWTLFDGDISGPQLTRKLQPPTQRR